MSHPRSVPLLRELWFVAAWRAAIAVWIGRPCWVFTRLRAVRSYRTLVTHSQSITDLRGLPDEVTMELLAKIVREGRLTYSLALVFQECGNVAVRECVELPCHMQLTCCHPSPLPLCFLFHSWISALDLLAGMPDTSHTTRRAWALANARLHCAMRQRVLRLQSPTHTRLLLADCSPK